MNTLGVVVCGGKSSRMGTDKGLILEGNMTWAERAYIKLSLLSIPVVVSINSEQINCYNKIFPSELLIEDALSIGGPLNGILSVHQQFPEKDLLLLACDMVRMEGALLQQLHNAFIQHRKSYDFFLFRNQGQAEPLCCIYTAKALNAIFHNVIEEKISRFGLKKILESGRCLYLDLENKDEIHFMNFNEPHQRLASDLK